MKNYKGSATVTFEDGEAATGIVEISYTRTNVSISGSGFFHHPRALRLQVMPGTPILTYGAISIPIHFNEAGMDGASFDTAGDPL